MGMRARMAVLLTTSVAAVLCQGCSMHSSVSNASVHPLVTLDPAAMTDGQRMATEARYGGEAPDSFDGVAVMAAATPSLLSGGISGVPRGVDLADLAIGDGVPYDAMFEIAPRRTLSATDGFDGFSWSQSEGLLALEGEREAAAYAQPNLEADQDFNAAFALAAPAAQTGLAFDLTLAPRVAYSEEGALLSRRVGAEVRVGQTLSDQFDQRGTRVDVDSWYIFAGQDGEALVWEAGDHGFSNITGAMALRDQVTVGDMQAGVSFQRGDGELSFSYIHREVEWRDRNGGASANEDFAGVTFTMKR